MPVLCEGIVMYDPRHSFKAPAAEAIPIGHSVYLTSAGTLLLVDNGKNDVCHGWALEAAAIGDVITVVRYCRMKVDTTQTIGAMVYAGQLAGGSAPSTTLGNGLVVGWAYEDDAVIVTAPNPPAANG